MPSSKDQRTALQQHVDPGNQSISDEASTSAYEGLDIDLTTDESAEAPRIECHLVGDDKNVTNHGTPANGEGTIKYATALPHKLSQSSSASVIYRWMNPRQRVEGLGEEEFAERLICRERP